MVNFILSLVLVENIVVIVIVLNLLVLELVILVMVISVDKFCKIEVFILGEIFKNIVGVYSIYFGFVLSSLIICGNDGL